MKAMLLLALAVLPLAVFAQESCNEDADCAYSYQCINHVCQYYVVHCTTDAQCADNYKCVNGDCRAPSHCTADADCAHGYQCFYGECRKPGAPGAVCGGTSFILLGFAAVMGFAALKR